MNNRAFIKKYLSIKSVVTFFLKIVHGIGFLKIAGRDIQSLVNLGNQPDWLMEIKWQENNCASLWAYKISVEYRTGDNRKR